MDNQKLANIRREYTLGRLTEEQLTDNPFDLLDTWIEDAEKAQITDPSAFVLSTVSAEGYPSQRIVLMKGMDKSTQTLFFYTNYQSQKAKEIQHNPQVNILFPWYMLDRQVIAQGMATRLDKATSQAYFHSRPKESQVAAIASLQSSVLKNKEELIAKYTALLSEYQDKEVPFPDNWGGFAITVSAIEFWQGGEHRLHDRFRYIKRTETTNASWTIQRISP